MTTGAVPNMRPLEIGQLLDQAIRIYRRNFVKFTAIIGVVQIPITLLSLVSSLVMFQSNVFQMGLQGPGAPPPTGLSEIFDVNYLVGMGGNCLVMVVSMVLIQGIATAVLTRAVADDYLGQPSGFGEAWRRIGPLLPQLMRAIALTFVCSIALAIWFLIPCIGWLSGFGMLLFFGQVILPLTALVVVLEKRGAMPAIRRAWNLTRRRFWWVIGFMTILLLFNQLVVGGPSFLIGLVFAFLRTSVLDLTEGYVIQTVAQTVVGLIAGLIYLPLQLTGITLMYFDLRIRTEGFDLALLAESASGAGAGVEEIVAQPSLPEDEGLITRTEFGYFVLVSVAAFALFGVLGVITGGLTGLASLGSF